MTAPDTLWAVTTIAHPALRDVRDDCPECLALTESAISHATVAGSVEATYRETKDGTEHSATVTRAVTAVIRSSNTSQVVDDTSTGTPTLGDIAELLRPLKGKDITRDSVRYVIDQVWWEDVEEERKHKEAATALVSRTADSNNGEVQQ